MEIINITSLAVQDLKEVLKAQKIDSKNLRIITSVGWGGVSFNLVLDEPDANDKVEEHEGLNFIIKNVLVEDYGPFKVETIKEGSQTYLQLIPSRQPESTGGCDSCSSCGWYMLMLI